jgi:hypothetical protein
VATCYQELKHQGARVLRDTLGLPHEWHETDTSVTLEFPKVEPTGFDVLIVAGMSEVVVTAGNLHTHFDDPKNPHELVRASLGLARDLLSPTMRLRERCAGGSPYRWILELKKGGKWVGQETVALLFWNYFGARSERILQNTQLPARPYPDD